jgi:mono/diheme cytochrome c family protein
MIAVAQVLFVVNMVQTLRGAERHAGRTVERDNLLVTADGLIVLIAVLLAIGAGAAGFFLGRETAPSGSPQASVAHPATAQVPAADAAGKQVFASAGCGGCHTLADSGSHGNVGPNLDDADPPVSLVLDRVAHGKGGMPGFAGQLSDAQIRAVARYVSAASR